MTMNNLYFLSLFAGFSIIANISMMIFFLKITSIYSSALARKWIAVYLLLIVGVLVLLSLLVGSDYGGNDRFIPSNQYF